ncbi:NAD(P)-binding domain-containing protein [Streptomyces sp. TRM72054]|uniref:lactate/malate family dehydrogenase n=1 Tax=Streptomyces sp. TRM72054 TaxID=2870562 RepID=UPI001C8CF311|nr:NAD(P)-binding domain-containing protein [Streptomyces sp. TRM72054]MBX9395682.1 NAD(P)-binding domain-containing protein [Streptomyces sp. TRM72054]
MTTRGRAVGVIGCGAVGQAVGGALVASGLCDLLLLASRAREQAEALATDLDDMRAALGSPAWPRAAEVAALRRCDAVVVAVRAQFANTRSVDIRMGGARANAPVIRDLAAQLADYPGTVLMVTNPVDLTTRLFAEESGCPRVFGIGSSLDTARYRHSLARHLQVPVHAVQGHVIGEHGDNAVVCASSTTVHGRLAACVPLQKIRSELAARPGRISAGIGRTRSGPAGAVLSALRLALGAADGLIELSTQYSGGYLGIPLRFSGGVPRPCMPSLNDVETEQLREACSKLRAAYQGLRETFPDPLLPVRNP